MDLPFEHKSSLKIFISAAIMGLIVYLINPIGIVNILWVSILGALIYFIIIFALKTISKKEINMIKSFF